jgi:hypothetical protein
MNDGGVREWGCVPGCAPSPTVLATQWRYRGQGGQQQQQQRRVEGTARATSSAINSSSSINDGGGELSYRCGWRREVRWAVVR